MFTLQWGRRLSPAEVCSCSAPASAAVPSFNGAAGFRPRKLEHVLWELGRTIIASMGPQAFARGSTLSSTTSLTPVLLQWGRRLSPAEVRGCANTLFFPGSASMGPQAFARGSFNVVQTEKWNSCFNGAAGFRPRKWDLPLHVVADSRCFNGAAGFRPRKCRRLDLVSVDGPRFNGAAGFRPRKWKSCVEFETLYC